MTSENTTRSNKVELKNIIIYNVSQCPECNSEKYAHLSTYLAGQTLTKVACNDCDVEAQMYSAFTGNKLSFDSHEKQYIEFNRAIFNNWNEHISSITGEPPKRVCITRKRTDEYVLHE